MIGKVSRFILPKVIGRNGGQVASRVLQKSAQPVFEATRPVTSAVTKETTGLAKKVYKAVMKKLRRGLAAGCKSKPVRDAYSEMYFAAQKGSKAAQQVTTQGAPGWLVKKGAWGWNFAREIGPMPLASYLGGVFLCPIPGSGEIFLLASLMGKKAIKQGTKKVGQFLTLVK